MKVDTATNGLSMVRGDSDSVTVSMDHRPFVDGDSVEFTVRTRATAPTKSIHIVVTEFEADGSAVINFEPKDTHNLRFGDYVYDIQLVTSTGWTKTFVESSPFTIREEVSYD